MVIGFPTNTVIFIIAAMLAAAIGAWVVLVRGIGQLAIASRVKRRWRWGIALLLGAWLLLRLAFAVNPPGNALLGPLFSVAFLVAGLLVGLLPLLLSPTFRQIIHAIPASWLVGIHAIRVGGFLFLALLDMRLLPASFALPAGYGDITVAVLALGLAYLLAQRKPAARWLAIGWNVLGLLDFVIALTTGFSTVGALSAQIAASGSSPLYVNYVGIVPSFGVPLFTLLHIYSLFQLLSARVDTTTQPVEAPMFARG